jgi:hypothetical protein
MMTMKAKTCRKFGAKSLRGQRSSPNKALAVSRTREYWDKLTEKEILRA